MSEYILFFVIIVLGIVLFVEVVKRRAKEAIFKKFSEDARKYGAKDYDDLMLKMDEELKRLKQAQ